MSIVDSERNAVSMTSTVNAYFGAKYLSPNTGIVLNNEMDDFSVPAKRSENVPPPAPANFIHPGKRPLSSMTPTIVLKVRFTIFPSVMSMTKWKRGLYKMILHSVHIISLSMLLTDSRKNKSSWTRNGS